VSASDVIAAPASIHAFCEDETVALKRTGTQWFGSGISVRTETNADRALPICVSSEQKRLLRLRLHWHAILPPERRFLRDAWERSYGDLGWRPLEPERIFPWYFLTGDGSSFTACGVKTNPGAFCFWQIDSSGITLWLDLRNGGSGVELGKRTLLAATIVSADYPKQTAFEATRKFCQRMADHGIFMPSPLYGGNNWYYAYGNSSADDIRADTERIASYAPSSANRPFMVIDDGWSPYRTTGPWTRGNARFPDMPQLASDMLRMNVKPGLWFRPLTTRDPVPDNFLLNSKFSAARFAKDQMRTLDPTIEGAAELIANDMRRLCSWGFQIIKHDFSTYDLLGRWGFQMTAEITDSEWHFADRTKTNAEIIRALYTALRASARTTFLLGCNTVGHLAAGLFEVQRTGDDTSGRDWSRTRKMGVNTLAFRAAQHRVFFDIDADCVGLTKAIPWSLNRQWLDLLARSGTPLFVSAAPDAVGPEQREAFREAFRSAAAWQPLCEPLDWLQTNEPERWRLGNKTAHFDWFTEAVSLPL
jgi:alpha-galactosidase